jgi:multidrug efflux pump subunit AcrA (membrane-fusion protein)
MPFSPAQRFHTIAVIAALAAAAGIVVFLVLRPGVVAERPPGVVQPAEIKIAPEISGRLSRFAVAAGQSVRKGDTLVELSNPELEAGLVLAQAQLGQARAARDRVYAGPRQEQVDALAQDIDMATANLVYAQQQFSRTSQLAATGFAGRRWASVNLREDQFGDLRIGSPIELLPLGGGDRVAAQVTAIIPRGEFAVWRAARLVGDYDLNTFLIRAEPVGLASEALQPGMSVWLKPATQTAQ